MSVPWPTARLLAHQSAAPTVSTVPLIAASNATLATNLVALTALPAFETVTMDGWAVSGRSPWRVVGEQLAGARSLRVRPGQAVAIATGAQFPSGADAIVRREAGVLEQRGEQLWLGASEGSARLDVRAVGEEAALGDVLLPRGTVLTPPGLGLAAAAGYDQLDVYSTPTIDVVVLGDELLTSGLPGTGRVRDALGPQAPGWISSAGAQVGSLTRVADTKTATVTALAGSNADIIVTTGGTARGPVDQLHPALDALGAEVIINQVDVRPGHPMLLAGRSRKSHRQLIIGLPGNPLAAAVAFASLALPVIAGWRGLALASLPNAATTVELQAPPSSHRLLPAQVDVSVDPDTGWSRATVTPLMHHGPAMLRGLALATHLVVIPPGGAATGDRVEVIALPWVSA